MKILIIVFTLISFEAHAFILAYKNYRLSKPDNTKVMISSEGCGSNVPDSELKDAIEKSVEMWSSVPESTLQLRYGGTSGTSITSPTIPSGQVIVGCGALPSGTAGATQHDLASGSARITLNTTNFAPGLYTADLLAGVIIHELGHAIGLTHSKDRASVMTYEANGWSPMPSYLAQDDMDGIVYLYPNKAQLGGLMGSCESLASDDSAESSMGIWLNLISGFLLSFGLFLIFKKLKKRIF